MSKKKGPVEASGPTEKWLEVVGGPTGDGVEQAQEVKEVVEPLLCKKRKLVKAVQAEATQGGAVVEAVEPTGEGREQAAVRPSRGEGVVAVGGRGRRCCP